MNFLIQVRCPNNYNPAILKARMKKINLQPVFNYNKAVFYMSTYFSKSDSLYSQALLQAGSKIRSMNLNAREAMHKLASSYSSSRQVSLQEAMSHSLPEIWLRKCFPGTVFVNTRILPKRIRICKPVEEIEELDPDTKSSRKIYWLTG